MRPHHRKEPLMSARVQALPATAAKPKPQPADDAAEQARRALQASLDTRQ